MYLTQLLVLSVKRGGPALTPQTSCFEGLYQALDKSQGQKTDRSRERKAKIFLFKDKNTFKASQVSHGH